MNPSRSIGLLLLGLGGLLMLVGLLVQAGAFSWFGRLPGDIHYERGNTQVYIPLTSLLLVSVVLTLLVKLRRRLL